MTISKLDQEEIFYYFHEISNVPRGSKYNRKISDYLVNFAKEHHLEYLQDEALNVVIRKPATKGYEQVPGIILQGHMDMVCVKTEDSNHDFEKDALALLTDGESIWADGTSLGGDDGIAIAFGLAILASDRYEHPALELLVTTDEEIGMDGAIAFDGSFLKGKWMINIDSEDENSILVGCAGGMSSVNTLPLVRKTAIDTGYAFYQLKISGLLGGHSGVEITKNRRNACILLGRLLFQMKESFPECELHIINGGQKDNVIAQVADCVLSIPDSRKDAFQEKIQKISQQLVNEVRANEPEIRILLDETSNCQPAPLTEESVFNIITYLHLVIDGLQRMSASVDGMAESSLNLGIMKSEEAAIHFTHCVRSSSPEYKSYMGEKLIMLAKLFQGTNHVHGDYPGWEYKPESAFRDLCIQEYPQIFKRQPIVETIHAGLECGILLSKKPELEIVSIGPDIKDIHSVHEKLSIESARRSFQYVLDILKNSIQLTK